MNIDAPTVLVHEFFSGGGCQQPHIPADLTAEGLAMLQALLADFRRWGRCRTLTTVDDQLPVPSLAADRVVPVSHSQYQEAFTDLLSQSDAALVVAPENDGMLYGLNALVEKHCVTCLGSDSLGAATAGDKWRSYRLFAGAGVSTPDTWRTRRETAAEIAEKAGYPLVIKPIDGAGSDGVGLVRDRHSLHRAVSADRYTNQAFLLQRYLDGGHYSVTLLVAESGAVALSLNRQFMRIGTSFDYEGGCIVSDLSPRHPAAAAATRAVSLIPGLRGYVGVDMVLADGRWYVIEINPRITTSYVGLRRAININLVEALWSATVADRLPQLTKITEETDFRKGNFNVI